VPDLYQGDELWNFSLVDPDNRRAVDFDRRTRLLEEVEHGFAAEPDRRHAFLAELVMQPLDGRLKLHTIRRLLSARRERAAVFLRGSYRPLYASGPGADFVVGFGREAGTQRAVILAPRLLAGRLAAESPSEAALWQDTLVELPAGWSGRWTCALSGESVENDPRGGLRLSDVFRLLPAACLLSEPPD
jgi:(1->4)-alpha-D-glucan 1-alpha-D-glucosylmutase